MFRWLRSSDMSTEWVAPVTTSALGVAGIAATYLAAARARTSQERSQVRAFEEERRRELTMARRLAYGQFLNALRELDLLARAQSAMSRTIRAGVDAQVEIIIEKAREGFEPADMERAGQEATRRLTAEVESLVKAEFGGLAFGDWVTRMGELGGLYQQVQLLAGPGVREAAEEAMGQIPLSAPRVELTEEQRKELARMPDLIKGLTAAMRAEVTEEEAAPVGRS